MINTDKHIVYFYDGNKNTAFAKKPVSLSLDHDSSFSTRELLVGPSTQWWYSAIAHYNCRFYKE